ncbi:ABC transporter permease subunit [Alteribacter natronophilus]|uniref:ABC transporter permease subunit n=1 Tax=Alteribacter natronophilus TaxID=2583810 RepID=UPI00110F55FB|nr:ABC transporter permease subunit [Alteribacter natronophilus]TMW73349.1 ABC transporter permease [Alteribacter natronophilus]
MKQLIRLTGNEWMKLRKRTGTKVMFVLLVAIVLAGGLITKYLIPHEEPSGGWEERLVQKNAALESELAAEETQGAARLEEQLLVNQYHLDSGVEPLTSQHMWSFFSDNGMVLSIITVFTVIAAAGSVSGEHSTGTIKLLLARPVNRWKILLSKWLAVLLFASVMLLVFITATLVIGTVLFPGGLSADRWVEVVNGEIRDWYAPFYGLTVYALQFIEVIIYAALAFMIGTVFKNQALSVGISLTALFMGSQIVFLLSGYEWAKYILFANTYLLQYLQGDPLVPGMSAAFSVIVLAAYLVLFLAVTFNVFTGRDVVD